MREDVIALTLGQFAVVDLSDFYWLSQYNWTAKRDDSTGKFYARRTYRENGERFYVYMHREIMGLTKGDKREVDHRNSFSLDNRRSNLRVVTSQQNKWNARTRKDNTSGFKGVKINKRLKRNPWFAVAEVSGKKYYSGGHASPEEAFAARGELIARLHGQFASNGTYETPAEIAALVAEKGKGA